MEHNKKLEAQLDRSAVAMEELKRDLERVRREAMTDGLTSLSNRKSFDEQIKKLSKDCNDEGKIFTLLMMDIDHFKAFNQRHGHAGRRRTPGAAGDISWDAAGSAGRRDRDGRQRHAERQRRL